jgi:Putative lumazine-binding
MAPRRRATDSELLAMRRTALDYIEAVYTWDADRMKRALHPKLAKRIVLTNSKTGRSGLWEYPASKLIRDTGNGYGKSRRVPKVLRKKRIRILVHDKGVHPQAGWSFDMGVARVESFDLIDYLQMAKWNGKWKVINVLWTSIRKAPQLGS